MNKLKEESEEGEGIVLAMATYEGSNKANPLEHYQWFPSWVKKENIF